MKTQGDKQSHSNKKSACLYFDYLCRFIVRFQTSKTYQPYRLKIGFLPMGKQRHKSALQ